MGAAVYWGHIGGTPPETATLTSNLARAQRKLSSVSVLRVLLSTKSFVQSIRRDDSCSLENPKKFDS